MARGDATHRSDLDVMVTNLGDHSWSEVMGWIETEASDFPVDIVFFDWLPASTVERMRKEAHATQPVVGG